MKRILVFLLIQTFLSGVYLNAQKITVKKGSLDFLKGQKSLLATFDYSNMGVGKFDIKRMIILQKKQLTIIKMRLEKETNGR